MTAIELAPDCSKCAALCCVLLAFDKSDFFAHDKTAGEKCLNLDECNQCTIHDELNDRGYSGCVRFNCVGAGQRVTQEVFGGRSWKDDAKLKAPMTAAFESMRHVHEALLLLREAEKLPLSQSEATKLSSFKNKLSPTQTWTIEGLSAFSASNLTVEVRDFLKTLRHHLSTDKH